MNASYPEPAKACMDVETTITDKLLNRQRRLVSELSDVNAALDSLRANLEVAKILTLVGKVIGRSL